MSLIEELGQTRYNQFISFVLSYIAKLVIPVKRGTFVELRTGMVNISPIGRNCSYEERLEFNRLDQEMGIRDAMVKALKKEFDGFELEFSIGGQISIDCYPKGWDKRYCLQFLEEGFTEIHFFGDKTMPVGAPLP
eukprot:GHVN01010083.1.p1 GENE.GHVN01010083.1~~GHVN01010083.1.p1  ORF type:complete len:157 (-),score=4.28 GHVN01010083.1:74-478(-)